MSGSNHKKDYNVAHKHHHAEDHRKFLLFRRHLTRTERLLGWFGPYKRIIADNGRLREQLYAQLNANTEAGSNGLWLLTRVEQLEEAKRWMDLGDTAKLDRTLDAEAENAILRQEEVRLKNLCEDLQRTNQRTLDAWQRTVDRFNIDDARGP